MDRIDDVGDQLSTGKQTRLAVSGNATWPFSWYLRDYPVNWAANLRDIDVPVLIVDKEVGRSRTTSAARATYDESAVPDPRLVGAEHADRAAVGELAVHARRVEPARLERRHHVRAQGPEAGHGVRAQVTVNPPPAARGYPAESDRCCSRSRSCRQPRRRARASTSETARRRPYGRGSLFVADSRTTASRSSYPMAPCSPPGALQGDRASDSSKDPQRRRDRSDGNVYVARHLEPSRPEVRSERQVSSRLGRLIRASGARAASPSAKDEHVYVTDTGNKRVVVLHSEGVQIDTGAATAPRPGSSIEPVGIAVNDAGEVVVARHRQPPHPGLPQRRNVSSAVSGLPAWKSSTPSRTSR